MQDARGVLDETAADACRDDSDEEVEDVSACSDETPLRAALEAVSGVDREEARDEKSVDDDGGECEHSAEEEEEVEEGEEEADPGGMRGRFVRWVGFSRSSELPRPLL